MAKNISSSSNNAITEGETLMTLDWCINRETKREKDVAALGRETPFMRTSKDSEELSLDSMISRRMKITLAEKTKNRAVVHNPIIDQIVEENCNRLTEEFQSSKICSTTEACNRNTEFRHISGFCNNLQNGQWGILFLLTVFFWDSHYVFLKVFPLPHWSDLLMLSTLMENLCQEEV